MCVNNLLPLIRFFEFFSINKIPLKDFIYFYCFIQPNIQIITIGLLFSNVYAFNPLHK